MSVKATHQQLSELLKDLPQVQISPLKQLWTLPSPASQALSIHDVARMSPAALGESLKQNLLQHFDCS